MDSRGEGLTELVNYVFGVFIGIIGGLLITVFLKVYFDVFRQVRVIILAHQTRVRSVFLEFL